MYSSEFKEKEGGNLSPRIHKLTLRHFRNYQTLEWQLGERFNVIAGPNGQGKTNLLEALHLVSTTRLLRGQREVEAIQEGADSAEVAVELQPLHTEVSFHLERGSRKRVLLNGMKLPRASDILGRLACVCISNEDMEFVRGEPANRRMFLDLELSSRSSAYLRHFSVYKRALDQRNALLKQAREEHIANELWEVWEDQLAEHGSAMRALRQQFVELLRGELPSLHREIGGGELAELQITSKEEGLRPDSENPEHARRVLAGSRSSDTARGSTSHGPHRDDLEFKIGEMSARLFGSQGQQRTFVIALKLATLILGKRLRGDAPLLLLDDIFSDLDLNRRAALVQIVIDVAEQTVLTCTEPEAAGPKILNQSNIFSVLGGRITYENSP
jgi:DNA replication and repair protein RecF